MKQTVIFITHWFTGYISTLQAFTRQIIDSGFFSCLHNTVQYTPFNSLINSEGSECTSKQTIVSNIKFVKGNSLGTFFLLWNIL